MRTALARGAALETAITTSTRRRVGNPGSTLAARAVPAASIPAACASCRKPGPRISKECCPPAKRRPIASGARICYQLQERMGDEAMRLGLIGCGAIGGEVVRAWQRGGLGPDVQLRAVLARRPRLEPG